MLSGGVAGPNAPQHRGLWRCQSLGQAVPGGRVRAAAELRRIIYKIIVLRTTCMAAMPFVLDSLDD